MGAVALLGPGRGRRVDDAIDPEATYAVEEVAALKGVTDAAVRSAIVGGELVADRTGRTWRVRGDDLLAWEPRRWRPVVPGTDDE
jgi:excisionase family DNA binding protein